MFSRKNLLFCIIAPSILFVIIVGFVVYATSHGIEQKQTIVMTEGEKIEEKTPSATTNDPSTTHQPAAITIVNSLIVVNKKNGVPASYAPGENPEAGAAMRQMVSAMQQQGLDVSTSYSGYRSYDYQSQLYNGYVAQYGQAETDTFSARPGYSEHQTGLAFDVLHSNGQLVTNSAEASWVAQNAHSYGFIMRYQAGKEAITGYLAEAWHIRYVGITHTAAIYTSGQTLEEYLAVDGGDYR